jgi:hypothetical protein
MRIFLSVCVALILVTAIGWWLFLGSPASSAPQPQLSDSSSQLAPEVEVILAEKTAILSALAQEVSIISAVNMSNQTNESMSSAEIERLDAEWQSSETITPFIAQFMSNATAQQLVAFQKANPEFKEVFIADAYGLNVAQTDKTSDYFQADESWWTDGYNEGRGSILHGSIEFDESSQTEAISIYVPVMQNSKAIGVFKGVLDLSAISSEL